ncbi:MAG: two-component system response regulator, partial [Gammaproteobacteria bacterium]|nr:two-component system response regulator [Gammaproteobacteria bacterium]
MSREPEATQSTRSLLLVDDDKVWLERLARAMKRRGYDVYTAGSVAEATVTAVRVRPAYAVI